MKSIDEMKKGIEKANKNREKDFLPKKFRKTAIKNRVHHLKDFIIYAFGYYQNQYLYYVERNTGKLNPFEFSSDYKKLITQVRATHTNDLIFHQFDLCYQLEYAVDTFYTYDETDFMSALLPALTEIVNKGFAVYLRKGKNYKETKFKIVMPSDAFANDKDAPYTYTVSTKGELIELTDENVEG